MIKTRKQLKNILKYESVFYNKKHPYLFRFAISEKSIAWKYVCLLRYEEYFTNRNNKILSLFFRYLKIKLGRKYCLQIPINVVKKGIRMYHPFNIIVNAKSIGENCVLHFDTCLIAGGNSKDTPTIGDNVIIGAKSVIIGGVTIANGVAIGANSTVTKSFFEENITIAGSPARKISDKGSSSW